MGPALAWCQGITREGWEGNLGYPRYQDCMVGREMETETAYVRDTETMCVYVCKRETETDRDRERETERRDRERQRETERDGERQRGERERALHTSQECEGPEELWINK